MDINKLRDETVKAVKERFPNEWGLEDRYISLVKQIGGFGEALQFRTGKAPKSNQHDTMQHQIACIMVDLFMLSDLLDTDIEKEMLSAIKWFKTGTK